LKNMEQKQPKIVQKLLLRTFFLLLTVAAVFLGIQFILNWRKDPDTGPANTIGMIAAIQIHDEGQQAVIFDKDGKKTPSPEYTPGKTDRDIVWLPNGNRLYFTSDRKEAAFNLYRWNPDKGTVVQRSSGSLSRFDPSFVPLEPGASKAELDGSGKFSLMTQGGFVLEFDMSELTSCQLLPPPGGVTQGADEGAGGSGQFDAIYKRLGNSFRTARMLKNQDYIVAVMKQDEGEVLVYQKLSGSAPEEQLPKAVMAGEHIDIDIDPKSGAVVFTVLSFQYPDRENIPKDKIKNGKVVRDFEHGVFMFNPYLPSSEMLQYIAVSRVPGQAFGPAVVSPDGNRIALTTGSYDGTTYTPAGMALMPLQKGGMAGGTPLVAGHIYEINWHPSGEKLTYIKSEGRSRSIYTISADGSSETKVSDDGAYMTPKFSPQTG